MNGVKIKIIGNIVGKRAFYNVEKSGRFIWHHDHDLKNFNFDSSIKEPQKIIFNNNYSYSVWAINNKLIEVFNMANLADEEISLIVKHYALKQDKSILKIKKELTAFENFEKIESSKKRNKIPDSVKMFVWQRDEGKCVKCGSREKLEFDHIIPFSEGGSDTERNIQILCESCNRAKSKNI